MTEPTRILVVSRLFSGLVDTLRHRLHSPSGVPAIYKLLEELDRRADIEVITVFCVKDRKTGSLFPHTQRFFLHGIGEVHILPWWNFGPNSTSLLATEIFQFLYCLQLHWHRRFEVGYFTNVNFMMAAAFKRMNLCRVILRLMGIFPSHRSIVRARRSIEKTLFRSPFDHVVCTQEGSGAECILPKLLNKNTPFSILLNGVDVNKPSEEEIHNLRNQYDMHGAMSILFLGRLEEYKGTNEFLEAMIALIKERRENIRVFIVGSGSLETELHRRVKAARVAEQITIVGSIPHKAVAVWHAACHIYVSLNKHGNLSNANLEALSNGGGCMILPAQDPETRIDEITEVLIPPEIVPRISRSNMATELKRTISMLMDKPGEIERLSLLTRRLSTQLLKSWPERIQTEIDIILDPEYNGIKTTN